MATALSGATSGACFLAIAAAALLRLTPSALAFNLDVKHAAVFADPSAQEGSYFGFSVGLMKKRDGVIPSGGGWLVVGAPKGNSSLYTHDIIEPGVAYLCGLEGGQGECKYMVLDDSGSDRFSSPNGYSSYEDNKNHAWIGASIAVQENGGKIVVCGPRWKNKYYRNFYLMNGVCYWLSDAKYFERNAGKLIPLLNTRNQGFRVPPEYDPDRDIDQIYYYAYGGAGMSVDFVANTSDIIIGAPGVFDWKGSVVRYRQSASPLGDGVASLNNGDLSRTYDGLLIPNPYRNEQINPAAYFGYSLGSGRFYSSKKVHYVAGAPRAGQLKGKVYIFEFPKAEDQPFSIAMELEGSQFGEYFGSSLCVVDLNSDGLDDLVVGAPQHSLKSTSHMHQSGDEGRIYVFLNEGQGIMTEIGDNMKLMGSEVVGARFGTTISNIGDLNGDGYPDIAVGAPFENHGAGVVYIYHGKDDGIHPKIAQRITAQEIDSSLQGFGISISKGADIDANHYNDIAVGAFSSGHAVVLRSHPVIAFHNKLTSNITKINIDATGFRFTACVYYTGTYAPAFTDVTVTLRADPYLGRAKFVGTSNRNQTLTMQHRLKHYVEHCEDFEVEILGVIHDLSKPIQIIMETEIRKQENENGNTPSNHRNLKRRDLNGKSFCGSCPVVDPLQSSHIDLKIPYATGCGEDNICRTDLQIEGHLINVGFPYVIGSSQSLRLNITVRNRGDPAFFSQIKITFSKVTPLNRIPKTCQEVTIDKSPSNEMSSTEKGLLCDTGNPMRPGTTKNFLFEFDAKQIPIGLENLVFNISASSVGEELTAGDNEMIFNVPLKTLADVTISGKSSQNQFYFNKEEKEEFEKIISFSHVYEVQNYGPSSIDQVKMVFEIPTVLRFGDDHQSFVRLYQPQTSLNSHAFSCTAEGGEFYSEAKEETIGGISPTGIPLTTSFTETPLNESDRQPLRHKRSAGKSQSYIYSPAYFPNNKTLFVNCSNTEESCIVVTCVAGPLKVSQTGGIIIFPVKVITSHFDHVFENKDVILFTSSGRVEILGMKHSIQPPVHRPDLVDVHTLFFGKLAEPKLDSWIIAVAIAGGILLLFFIVMGLMKMGFFKRGTKEELEALKSKAEMEENFGSDIE